MEIRSNETIKQAVIAGMGVSFLSSHAIALDVRAGNLVVLDVDGFPAWRHWYVVHRAEKRLPAIAAAFRAFLLADGARLIAEAGDLDASQGGRRAEPDRRLTAPDISHTLVALSFGGSGQSIRAARWRARTRPADSGRFGTDKT